MHSSWWVHIFVILEHFHLLVREWGEGADLKSESVNFFEKYQFILSLSFNFFWEQECETETYSISLKASVVAFASIFQINFFLVRSLALILPLFFAVVFLPLMFCPCPFFALKFCPYLFFALKLLGKKEGKGKIYFCPLIHFPMYFALKFCPCPCPCPLFLPSFSGQKKRARARAKFEGKIHRKMNQRAKIDLPSFFPNNLRAKKEGKGKI